MPSTGTITCTLLARAKQLHTIPAGISLAFFAVTLTLAVCTVVPLGRPVLIAAIAVFALANLAVLPFAFFVVCILFTPLLKQLINKTTAYII